MENIEVKEIPLPVEREHVPTVSEKKKRRKIGKYTHARTEMLKGILKTEKYVKDFRNGRTYIDWDKVASEIPNARKILGLNSRDGKNRLSVAVVNVRKWLSKNAWTAEKVKEPENPGSGVGFYTITATSGDSIPATVEQVSPGRRVNFCPDCGTAIEQNTWQTCPVCSLDLKTVSINRE